MVAPSPSAIRLERCKRCSFYQQIVDKVAEPLRIKIAQVRTSLEKKIKWIGRQVILSLHQLRKVLGKDYHTVMTNVFESNKHRWSQRHDAFVNTYKREIEEEVRVEDLVAIATG